MKRASLKDVAIEAKVSIATASYVINDTAGQTLTDETRQRVIAAKEKLGYVPNMAARSIVSKKSRMIGIFFPQAGDGADSMLSNPLNGELVSCIETEARREKHNYHVLVSGGGSGDAYWSAATTRSLDGIVVVGLEDEDECGRIKSLGIPAVLVDCYCDAASDFHNVRSDDLNGGYLATLSLLDKGFTRIAFAGGSLKVPSAAKQRHEGYLKALRERGLEPEEGLSIECRASFDHGARAGKMLATKNKRPDAVCASSDLVAAGVCAGFSAEGLRVPEDISVIGFDDSLVAKVCNPQLSSVNQDIISKGQKVLEFLSDSKQWPRKSAVLSVTLVNRGSVADKSFDRRNG
jgi:LacI family transcriptional regulator